MNLWRLYNVATAYGQRPSQIVPTETALSDYQLDEACLFVGRQTEKRLNKNEAPFDEPGGAPANSGKVRSMRGMATKTVRVKPDGTW